jgi:hypothetical protein
MNENNAAIDHGSKVRVTESQEIHERIQFKLAFPAVRHKTETTATSHT